MGVRHVCFMCVILWTVFSQLYSAPVPARSDDVTRPIRSILPSRRRNAIMFPTEEAPPSSPEEPLGHRTIFQHRCASGYASLGGLGCRRVADFSQRSRPAFDPIFLGF